MALQDWIGQQYLDEEMMRKLRAQFTSSKPFPNLEIRKFLRIDKAKLLRNALQTEHWTPKEADLFKLKHTSDIASSNNPLLREFRLFLLSEECMRYMESITGLKLKRKVIDLAGSLYENTDYLLCHDDQLEGRKIAFLFYLCDMSLKDGGALGLLDKKFKTKKRIVPKMGTLAFFEVSPVSYHEVEEVIVAKQRLALGGWYHG